MTVDVTDSLEKLSSRGQEKHKQDCFSVLLYADDTLIIGSSEPGLQGLLNAIA